jgi:hypothetical protein
MVYVGGTDNGRWIPELLNDTNDGERHIIVLKTPWPTAPMSITWGCNTTTV